MNSNTNKICLTIIICTIIIAIAIVLSASFNRYEYSSSNNIIIDRFTGKLVNP